MKTLIALLLLASFTFAQQQTNYRPASSDYDAVNVTNENDSAGDANVGDTDGNAATGDTVELIDDESDGGANFDDSVDGETATYSEADGEFVGDIIVRDGIPYLLVVRFYWFFNLENVRQWRMEITLKAIIMEPDGTYNDLSWTYATQ